MRFTYKIIPLPKPHPAFPDERSAWMPYLPVRLSVTDGTPTPRIEALIDSGSAYTLFRADIGLALGLDVTGGIHTVTGGIVSGQAIDMYFHDVTLWLGADVIDITAGFSPQMSIGAILGRRGFFEHFIITFDPSADPPGFDIHRLGRT